MDIAGEKSETRFAKIVRKIWNGPYQDLEAEEFSPMKQEQSNETDSSRMNYARHGEMYRTSPEEQERVPSGGYGVSPKRFESDPDEPAGFSKAVTVISQGTTITGDIKSDSNIEMLGNMAGSIVTSGNVKINGKQNGDVQGSSIDLLACTVRGNLNAAEDVNVDGDSVIVGDIKCGNLIIDGKLKGNVHVMGNVSCQSNAVLLGDVTSTTITISSGAKLKGKVEISDGSIDSIDIKDGAPAPAEK